MAITTRYGCEVKIIKPIYNDEDIMGCVAQRLEDGSERSYMLGELKAPGGAQEVYDAIALVAQIHQ